MAVFVLKDYFVKLGSETLSDHVKSLTLNYSAELQDDTAMGDDTRSRIGGLKDWSLDIEFLQDFGASEVDVTLEPLVGETFSVELRPTSGTVSSTNPKYYGTGILESYPPMAGAVGDLAMTNITILAAGTLNRGESA